MAVKERFKDYHSLRTDNLRLYAIWRGIKVRCKLPNDQHHRAYYDRGITVCKEWDESFETFYKWAMETNYNDEMTIERINVNGNYCPKNCMWIPKYQQAWNRQSTRYFEIDGYKYRTDEIETVFGIKPITFLARIDRYGYTPEEAAKTPVKHSGGRKKKQ